MEQLHEFRSKLGLIQKTRRGADKTDEVSNAFDGITVKTPNPDPEELDRLSAKLSTVGLKDVSAGASKSQKDTAGGMSKFVQNLMKNDRDQYERLVELLRYVNMIDIDLRQVS